MTQTADTSPRPRRFRWALIATICLIAIVGGIALASAFGLETQSLPLRDLLASQTDIHPVETTAELCADVGCVEGWQTDIGSYLSFDSNGNAEHWLQILGNDGRQWQNIILDMRDYDLKFEQTRKAVDILFSTRDWS